MKSSFLASAGMRGVRRTDLRGREQAACEKRIRWVRGVMTYEQRGERARSDRPRRAERASGTSLQLIAESRSVWNARASQRPRV